jgi:hypothetical protein
MTSPIAEPSQRNRLTIAFLMLWTLGSALILACNRALEDSQPSGQLGMAHSFYLLGYALTYGVALASVPIFLTRKITGSCDFPTQPGHWILIVRGFTILLWMAGWACRVAIERLWIGEKPQTPSLYLAMQYVPASLLACIAYLIAWSHWSSEGRVWRLTLGLMIFNAATGFLVSLAVIFVVEPAGGVLLPYSLNSCLNPVIGLALISAVLGDRGKRRRDFLHWAGVFCALAMTVMPFIYSLLIYLFRS